MLKPLCLSLFVLVVFNTVFGQTYTPRLISAQDAAEDIDVFYNTLIEAHPALFLYTDRVEFDSAITNLKAGITDSIDCLTLYRKLVKFNDLIHCVHSDIRPPETFKVWFDTAALFLPINIMAVGDGYYVSENLSGNDSLNRGTRVVAINNIPVAYILRKILSAIPSDGFNTTRKYDVIKWNFNRYFMLLFGPSAGPHSITIKQNNSIAVIRHPGLTRHELLRQRLIAKTPKSAIEFIESGPIDLKLLPDKSTAILSVRSFRHDLMEEANLNFRHTMDSCFQKIRSNGSKHLIIDLRNNHGGYSEYGATLLEYVATGDFTYCTKMVTTGKVPALLELEVAETFPGFPKGVVFKDNEFLWPDHTILGIRKRSEHAFNGRVYFLVDGSGVSTTAECVSIAQFYNMGTCIGEPVGGSYKGDNGGVLGYLKLPHSGINVRIAMVRYVLSGAETNGKHAEPDHEIVPSIGQLKNNEDIHMSVALDLIEESTSAQKK